MTAEPQPPAALERDFLEIGFWQRLAPSLRLSTSIDLAGVANPAPAGEELEVLAGRVRTDGVCLSRAPALLARAAHMVAGIDEVRSGFGHPLFALLYDDFWLALASQRKTLEAFLGAGVRAVPLPYVNYVPPGDAGFTPHRDRYHDPLAPDGMPNMMTAWFALTDAPPERACLGCLPIRFDPCFPDQLRSIKVTDLRNVRMLPVVSADVVLFNQAMVHWGARNATAQPRVSFAFEVERADSPAPRSPAILLDQALSFDERLGFVGAIVEGLNRNNLPFSLHHRAQARAMCEHFHGDRFTAPQQPG